MPRLKLRRIFYCLVIVCVIYCVVFNWISLVYENNVGGKRRLRPREIERSEKDTGLFKSRESEVYDIEYLQRLNQIKTPQDQRKYDEGIIFLLFKIYYNLCIVYTDLC